MSSPHLNSDLPSEDKVGGDVGLPDPSFRRLRRGIGLLGLTELQSETLPQKKTKGREEGKKEGMEERERKEREEGGRGGKKVKRRKEWGEGGKVGVGQIH